MENEIYEMKDQLVRLAKQQLNRGIENVDTQEMGMVVDMIKDLAEAEKACYEAEYYMSVVDAMEEAEEERYGYDDGQSRQGYQERYYPNEGGTDRMGRMGYKNQYGNWRANPGGRRKPRRMRQGYSEESIDNIKGIMESADPARREQLKKDLQQLMQEM